MRSEAPGRLLACGALACSLLAVGGCAATPEASPSTDPSSFASAGPWAQEFADAMAEGSAYERRVLEDGTITAAENADAIERLRTCMKDAGYVYEEHDDGTADAKDARGADLGNGDKINAAYQKCSGRFDRGITYLFNEIRRNPEKQDEATIMVACLRRSGLVGKEYTKRKWLSEDDKGVYSFDYWGAKGTQCRLDPLGLWRQR